MSTGNDAPGSEQVAPDIAAEPRWIVCEQTGAWATALRRQPASSGIRIHETRSLAECWETLGRAEGSFAVVELTRQNLDALLDRLARLPRECPRVRVAVVAERSLAEYEELVREAGAVCFVTSPRELEPLAKVARCHLEQAPSPHRSLSQQIWASLPWGNREC